jgi:putative DNA methylase
MIPLQCRRLAEADFPLAIVSRQSAREKSIRHGHPSTMHLWWARRPLAACRAVLLALLLPDPCDPHCPAPFKAAARLALRPVPGIADPSDDASLRKALLRFAADFSSWDLAADPTYIGAARSLVTAAHGDEPPLVVDPFAGGGSVPLEALRLGCDAFASDLNPVACLLLRVLLDDLPRYGVALSGDLRLAAADVRASAWREMAQFYPMHKARRTIAYLWARVVRCETPNCGAEVPLVRSLWLGQRGARGSALRYEVRHPKGSPPHLVLSIFEPTSEAEVQRGTTSRANATCPCCRTVLPAARVRAQLMAQRGGADVVFDRDGNRVGGALMLAVVELRDGQTGRRYRLPGPDDYAAVNAAQAALRQLPPGAVPDEVLPLMSGTFNVPLYGMATWGDLFTARQKLSLVRVAQSIAGAPSGDQGPASRVLALALGRLADYSSSLCRWVPHGEFVANTYGRQALPMIWDFCEVNPFSDSTGSFSGAAERIAAVIERVARAGMSPGQVQMADARTSPLPSGSSSVWFTDPPYYFAVPYADLSDFFFVWLKRSLPGYALLRDPWNPANPLTPKDAELCEMAHWDSLRYPHKDQSFFEQGVTAAFTEGRRVLKEDGIGCVVFAHKTTEGWEALLSGMRTAGWVITASWPITTERATRLRARDSAALAASIHLICRPRGDDAPTGGWEDILRELPKRIGEWMDRLSAESIRGADLVFSCIGPAMELFSQYPRVETAEGEEVGLAPRQDGESPAAQRGFLSYVWEAVGRAALRQVLGQAEGEAADGSAAAALEEDARLTALFLWTLQSADDGNDGPLPREGDGAEEADEDEDAVGTSRSRRARAAGLTLIYDIARRFAQPLGIHLDEWEGRVIDTDRGVVRLLSVSERSEQLFGPEGAAAMAEALARGSIRSPQLGLFPEDEPAAAPRVRGRSARHGRPQSQESGQTGRRREPTTLDRVHAAMLLQATGQSGALRALLEEEQRRGPEFFRLANALSALYPRSSEEKRLVDAMLVAVPR